jgi:hypothetical protein
MALAKFLNATANFERRWKNRSQSQLGMRSQPHQAQDVCIRFLIDKNEVRLYVAVPVIFPVASQGVVAVTWL